MVRCVDKPIESAMRPYPPPLSGKLKGFTLIELMVTVAILAILASIAAPQMQNQIAASRVTATTNELLAGLAQARSEAVRLGQGINFNTSSVPSRTDVSLSGDIAATPITFRPDGTTTNTGTITISNSVRTRTIQVLGSGKAFISNS